MERGWDIFAVVKIISTGVVAATPIYDACTPHIQTHTDAYIQTHRHTHPHAHMRTHTTLAGRE